jgi:hypothetical protein
MLPARAGSDALLHPNLSAADLPCLIYLREKTELNKTRIINLLISTICLKQVNLKTIEWGEKPFQKAGRV